MQQDSPFQRRVSADDAGGARIARTLIDLFQHGIRHKKQLISMLIATGFP
jgi:hypothetical protein